MRAQESQPVMFFGLCTLIRESRPRQAGQSKRLLADPKVAGGCFRFHIVPSRWIYRIRDAIGNFCVEWFGVALGDRGFFCRRDAFVRIGGYPGNSIIGRCGILSKAEEMRARPAITGKDSNQCTPLRNARPSHDRLFLRHDHDALRHARAAFAPRKDGALVCR